MACLYIRSSLPNLHMGTLTYIGSLATNLAAEDRGRNIWKLRRSASSGLVKASEPSIFCWFTWFLTRKGIYEENEYRARSESRGG